MADLAFGISKAAVQLLADKVKSALKEEAEQWQTVQRDLLFITGEFEMMQSFLNIADTERVKNDVVKTWVRQVRDLSYDVEDCIEFVLKLDTDKRSWWLRLLPFCGKTEAALPVDEAVTETTLLRARVVDVSKRNIRYNLIVDSGSKPIVPQVQSSAAASTSSFDIHINAIKKSGILDLPGLIISEDEDLQVISVCGSEGDFGKATIIKKVHSDSRIRKQFECRAWVKLMHPFNPHAFIQSLMVQFSCQEQEGIVGLDMLTRMQATQEDLTKEFSQKVNTHKFLIILEVEDISTMVQWDAIRSYLPDRKKGSRIVVLTHQPVIASLCTGEPCRVSELDQFSPYHSVRVYFKEGFKHDRVHSFVKEEPYHSSCRCGLLGRDSEVDELINGLKKYRLISVWGMPGVGKSLLVRDIYSKISDNFEKQAWVSVSHPFNPMDFSWSLLLSLHSKSSLDGKYRKTVAAEDPIKECRDLLRAYVCLVVIDGVQSKEDWDWIESNLIQHLDSRSRIILITMEESVAKHCAVPSKDAVYYIKSLQHDVALKLFKKVFYWSEMYLAEQWMMKEEARHILSKCGGLPEVIINLARYLATRRTDLSVMQEMRRLRENFMHELATNLEFDSLRGILAWMHSYWDACPRHLKASMLYLLIFPQDTIIQRRRLIRRLIAEGYTKGTDCKSMEKHAEKLFDEVAAMSIMQPELGRNEVIGYRVNGFFWEYIISRPAEERIFFPVEVSALEEGYGRLSTERIGQHLTVIGELSDEDEVVFGSLDFSRLRSLTVFGAFHSFYVSDKMRVLRVLDLEDARGVCDSHFDEIGKLPPRLKFLSLRGQRLISRLPDSVGDLMQLQTLDIRGTRIATVPPFIIRLQKLQYIHAGTTIAWTDDDSFAAEQDDDSSSEAWTDDDSKLLPCLPKFCTRRPVVSASGGVKVPRGIGKLKALRVLGAVRANTEDGVGILDEIVSLSRCHLKKLEIHSINRKNNWFTERMSFRGHLESLSLQFEEDVHFPPWALYLPSLRSLKMYGLVQELPQKIWELANLMKLTLEMTTLFTPEVIQVLGRLQSLRTLRLRVNKDQDGELNFPHVKEDQDGDLNFPDVSKDQDGELPSSTLFSELKVLEIASKSKLHVSLEIGAMKKLEVLKIHCLDGSEMQFSGLEHPVSLRQVWLLRRFDNALEEALHQQLDRHPKKPALKVDF